MCLIIHNTISSAPSLAINNWFLLSKELIVSCIYQSQMNVTRVLILDSEQYVCKAFNGLFIILFCKFLYINILKYDIRELLQRLTEKIKHYLLGWYLF